MARLVKTIVCSFSRVQSIASKLMVVLIILAVGLAMLGWFYFLAWLAWKAVMFVFGPN